MGECSLNKCGDDPKPGQWMSRQRNTPQRDQARLEKWAGRNLVGFTKEQSRALHLGRSKPSTSKGPRSPAAHQLDLELQ